jgi:CRISPR/Cas system-associated exonuclease Cas4 (RecB family)
MKDIQFDHKKHVYSIDGVELVSVTTFVKQHFVPFDSQNISKYVAKSRNTTPGKIRKEWKAIAEEGTKIHKEIQEYIEHHKIPKNPKAMNGIMYLKEECKDDVLLLSEIMVGSKKYGIAGTIDLLRLSVDDEGKLYCTMFDWKTNSKIKVSGGSHGITPETEDLQDNHLTTYSLQMSAYKFLIEETLGFYVDNMFIVHLEEDCTTQIPAIDYTDKIRKMLKRYKNER